MSPLLTGLVLVIVGLIGVFWGYRVFRILLPLYGAVAGYLVAYHWLGQDSVFLALIVGVVLAVIFALIAYLYWSVLVAIAGVILGIGVAALIAGSLNLGNFLFYLLAAVFAVVGGWLLWKIRDELIIILTVLFGAGAAAEGVGMMLGLQTGFESPAQANPTWLLLLLAVVWIVLVVVGLMWQWPRYRHLGLYGFGGPVPQPAAPAAKAAPAVAATTQAPSQAATRSGEGVSVAGAAAVGATAAVVASKPEEPPAPVVVAAMTEEVAEPAPMATEASVEEEAVSEEQVGQIIDQMEENYGLEDAAKFKESLDFVEGVGPAYAEKLRAAGVLTVLDLLRRGATRKGRGELAEETGITGKLILKWVNHADLFRVKGVGAEYADLLEAAGVDTVVELAQRNSTNLLAKMLEVNTAKQLVRKAPYQAQVDEWVAQAKTLPRIIQY